MIICSPHVLSARFELGALIGAGNYAEIFRATDAEDDASVAIKVLRSEHAQDPTALSLFEQEAAIGLTLAHENIVKTRQIGRAGDTHFIVMDLVAGVSLRRRIQLTGRVPVTDALRIILGILSGLEAIHAAGYIHRDIKPQNILLEATGTPKVADFGIAIRQGEPGVSVEGVALGTAAYIAPEQASGQAIGPEADVYAAGAVLFEMLTGQAPFPGDDPEVVMDRHLSEPPPDPRSLNPEVSAALATVILRALAKHPKDRFASAHEMRQTLLTLHSEVEDRSRFGVTRARDLFGLPRSRPGGISGDQEHGPSARTLVPALMTTILFIVLVLALVSTGAVRTSRTQIASNTKPSPQANAIAQAPAEARQLDIPTGWSASADVSSPRESTAPLPGASASAAVSPPNPTNLTIYDNSLATGWDTSLSWSAAVELTALETPQSTARSISYTPTGAWAGLQIRSDGKVNTRSYSAIQFSVKSTRTGEPLAIYLRDASYRNLTNPIPLDTFGGTPSANGWVTYTIPLADLNASDVTLGSIVIHSWTNRAQPTVYVNDIRLLIAS